MTDIHNEVACEWLLGDRAVAIAETWHGDVVVPAGETGTVLDVDQDTSVLVIKLDRYLRDLDHARNFICVRSNSVVYLF